MVDYRLYLGVVALLALGVVLVRQLYPGPLSAGTRAALDLVTLAFVVVAAVLVLQLLGLL